MSSAKEDVETLMNKFIGTAERIIGEFGDFHPYGAAMTPDREHVFIAKEVNDNTTSESIIDRLNEEFESAAKSGEYIATALFYDTRVAFPDDRPESKAVAVALDHRDDYSVIAIHPYQIEDGKVSFGELLALRGANKIFGSLS